LLKAPRGIAVFEAPEPAVLPGLLIGIAGLSAVGRLRRWPRHGGER
jgi:hypothetical protein